MAVFATIAGGISIILSVESQMTQSISDNTYRISIWQADFMDEEIDNDQFFTNRNLLLWLRKQENFTFYKSRYDERFCYSDGSSNSMYNVEEGAAYINEWNRADVFARGNSYYFYWDSIEYEVVGYMNNFISILANIVPMLEKNSQEIISGTFFIDAGEESVSLIQDLSAEIQKINSEADISYAEVKDTWVDELFNQSGALLIFLSCSALLFVSGFSIILSWVDKHKREMFVRRLSGAGEVRLLLRLYSHMLITRIAGILLGGMSIFVITNILKLLPYNTVFRMESVIVGIILFFILDIIYTLPMLFINQKRQLVKIMR